MLMELDDELYKVPDAGCLNKLLLNAPRDLRVENLDKMWVQKLWY